VCFRGMWSEGVNNVGHGPKAVFCEHVNDSCEFHKSENIFVQLNTKGALHLTTVKGR
jgi:hypothetical protein